MGRFDCLMGGCAATYARCEHCGHNRHERDRRLQLPLIQGADGLLRKYVGIPEEEGEKDSYAGKETEAQAACDNPSDAADV